MTLIIGLTGGIGSGKTTACDCFKALGIDVIEADRVVSDLLTHDKQVIQQIIEHFGPTVLNSEEQLDRSTLRKLIFNNANAKAWMESLLHPLVRKTMEHKITQVTSPYCILDIPLLIETLPNHLVERVLVIDTPIELQIKRVIARDRISKEDALKIIQHQIDRETRLNRADDIIENTGDLEALKQQIGSLHQALLEHLSD